MTADDERRQKALADYRKRLREHRDIDASLKTSLLSLASIGAPLNSTVEREKLKELSNEFEKSENNLKALQSVGQVSPQPKKHRHKGENDREFFLADRRSTETIDRGKM